jgi:hypothetical protein
MATATYQTSAMAAATLEQISSHHQALKTVGKPSYPNTCHAIPHTNILPCKAINRFKIHFPHMPFTTIEKIEVLNPRLAEALMRVALEIDARSDIRTLGELKRDLWVVDKREKNRLQKQDGVKRREKW